MATELELDFSRGVAALPAAAWDALVSPDDPFLEHAFLKALEDSQSVGDDTGWLPRFVLARRGGELVGAVPLYLKTHSYGEFVFDWAWASAAERARIRYYPKLVAAVPFTPATGRRLLVRTGSGREEAAEIQATLARGILALAEQTKVSSVHVLFCTEEESRFLAEAGFAPRLGLQFHWTNRAPTPYANFDDFLSAFRSRNRKQVRKERTIAASHGLELRTRRGTELDDADWAALEAFYEANIDKHDGSRYLTRAFFRQIRQHLPHRVVATFAKRGSTAIAGTLNFERGKNLYGRYWGCLEEHEMLHFELCYYRLIERAVDQGYARFEAGAQGEHKLKRGLEPTLTHSNHWVRHPGLAEAIGRFLVAESDAVVRQQAEYQASSPYARTGPGAEPEPDPAA